MRHVPSAVAVLLTPLLALPAPATAQDQHGAVTSSSAAYRLRPGDILDVRVWGHEEFEGRFQVDEDWHIQYPGVGEIDVRDLTITDVRNRLRGALEALFQNPFITVTPLFRMAVLGEVRNAGLYTVNPTLSVLDVVALAGGPSPAGNLSKIRLLRAGSETRIDFERATLTGRTLGEIGVRSGDQILVPRRWFTREDLYLLIGLAQLALSVAIFINTVN